MLKEKLFVYKDSLFVSYKKIKIEAYVKVKHKNYVVKVTPKGHNHYSDYTCNTLIVLISTN